MHEELDISKLVASLPALRRELESATVRFADAERELRALEEIISGIEKLSGTVGQISLRLSENEGKPSAKPSPGASPPRGRDAIREVMADGRPWRQQEIIAEIKRRGWVKAGGRDPDSAIRETVRRLTALGVIEKLEYGTYRLTRRPNGERIDTE